MKLSFDEIEKIACGANYMIETADGIEFHRFTRAQEELYKKRSADFYSKTFSTSGVRLSFYTTSRSLYLSFDTVKASSRFFYCFDILVNGVRKWSIDNFSYAPIPEEYFKFEFPNTDKRGYFNLGGGEKKVDILFPWSAQGILKELSLDDGTTVRSTENNKKLLIFGDSITQGYDALYPSSCYSGSLCRKFGFEEYNMGIGGEITFPGLAALKINCTPDFIISAYGTNDWYLITEKEFIENSESFYSNLISNYPNAEIFCLAPIWRKDHSDNKSFGRFGNISKRMKEICEDSKKIRFIDGFDFVPHDSTYFSDAHVHPNDNGFMKYSAALEQEFVKKREQP